MLIQTWRLCYFIWMSALQVVLESIRCEKGSCRLMVPGLWWGVAWGWLGGNPQWCECGAGCKVTAFLGPWSCSRVLRAKQNLDPDLKYQNWRSSLAIIGYWCQSNIAIILKHCKLNIQPNPACQCTCRKTNGCMPVTGLKKPSHLKLQMKGNISRGIFHLHLSGSSPKL